MLRINRIRLKLFTGMFLKEIEEFDLRTKNAIQIILGRNGCGKTRLLRVLYPVCPSKSDLRDGGEYFNEFEFNGVVFHATIKRKGGKLQCSLKNVTENIQIVKNVNPKVYNANIEDLIRITPAMVPVLVGDEDYELCRLATAARKHWFTRLSVSDLSYGLTLHKKLKDHSRDLVGAIKHGQTKISEIKPRVLESEQERAELAKHLKLISKEIEDYGASIQEIKNHNDFAPVSDSQWEQYKAEVETFANKVVKARSGTTDDIIRLNLTLSDLEEERVRVMSRAAYKETELGDLLNTKQKYEFYLGNSKGLIDQVESLKQTITTAAKSDDVLFKQLFNFKRTGTSELTNAIRDVNSFSGTLTGALDTLTTDLSKSAIEERLATIQGHMTSITKVLSDVTKLKDKDTHTLEHYRSVDWVDCPKCENHFKPGVGGLNVEELEASVNKCLETIKKGETRYAELEREAKELEVQLEAYVKVFSIVEMYSRDMVLGYLFTRVVEEDLIYKGRDKVGAYLKQFVSDLESAIEASKIYSTYNEKKAALEKISASSDVNHEELTANIANAEEVLSQALEHRELVEAKIAGIKKEIKLIEQFQANAEHFQNLIGKSKEIYVKYNLTKFMSDMSERRDELWKTYDLSRKRSMEMEEEFKRLTEIENEVDTLQKRQKTAQTLVRAMSPEKGLLRKYFYQAIARITDMMNKHISAVWEYPMTVEPCNIEDGDMDYKFPFIIDTQDEPAPDVKCGSSAQRDMFNLAFRLTAYKALGLNGYPLIIDEIGAKMDESHRDRLVEFVKDIVDFGTHSQAFIVSHNADVHSRMNEADFVVVSPDGITPPASYNENVSIKLRG